MDVIVRDWDKNANQAKLLVFAEKFDIETSYNDEPENSMTFSGHVQTIGKMVREFPETDFFVWSFTNNELKEMIELIKLWRK